MKNVNETIAELRNLGVLTGPGRVDAAKFEALRSAVKKHFHVPATTITPPMERLLYSCAAVNQPQRMLAIGIFCGNTLIWNAGACCGPGKSFDAKRITGVEIDENSIAVARSNVAKLGLQREIELLCADGHEVIRQYEGPIDYLYLDADAKDKEGPSRGKRIYLTLLELAYSKLAPGAIVLAHDTTIPAFVNEDGVAHDYLVYVRDSQRFRRSVSVEIEHWGIEMSVK